MIAIISTWEIIAQVFLHGQLHSSERYVRNELPNPQKQDYCLILEEMSGKRPKKDKGGTKSKEDALLEVPH